MLFAKLFLGDRLRISITSKLILSFRYTGCKLATFILFKTLLVCIYTSPSSLICVFLEAISYSFFSIAFRTYSFN